MPQLDERKSDSSGKKLKIGSSRLRISPRSIAIPSTSEATLFETDFKSCNVTGSNVAFLEWPKSGANPHSRR